MIWTFVISIYFTYTIYIWDHYIMQYQKRPLGNMEACLCHGQQLWWLPCSKNKVGRFIMSRHCSSWTWISCVLQILKFSFCQHVAICPPPPLEIMKSCYDLWKNAASPAFLTLTLTPLSLWPVPRTHNQNRTFPTKCKGWSLRRTQHSSLSSCPPACLNSCIT